jgi:peroxiredoxin
VEPAKVAALTKDFATWYRYAYYHLLLSRDFKALDTDGQPIPKSAFLRQLATGRVLALVNRTQPQPIYQLCAYPDNVDDDPAIRATSKQLAQMELSNYNREGERLPDFKFVDLKGGTYTQASTRGKIVVLKCWYIGCSACVEEFPAINALVDNYAHRPDVVFISLAMNQAPRLREFLPGREVKFAVVPARPSYLVDTLQVLQYPTHVILGRDGQIAKVTNRASDLAVALQQVVPSY